MNRREALQTVGAFCGLVVAGGLSGCGSTHQYVNATESSDRLTVRKTDFPSPSSVVFVTATKLPFPVSLCRTDSDHYSASLMQCTHKGCELQPEAERLVCPCHGSQFALDGAVLSNPATERLKQFRVTSDDRNIYIHL